ncbi:MAG: DAK2 domain-containing protein [Oscillospiraceae bacterium]|nr:DAK2 domain-containing protein [Oscillospiraceae bacterium]
MILCAGAALEANRQHINDLNVFPVPDGDTGTNMSMTLSAGAEQLRAARPSSVGEASKIAASALLRGARGNSGVILSLLFRGMSKSLKGKDACSAADFAKAMGEGVEAAYSAVMKPAEGTILTVSRLAAAAAADFAASGTDLELLLSCALEAAKDALAETVNQNPVLKKAGVIDAGGEGYVVILAAMLASLRGEAAPEPPQAAPTLLSDHADFTDFDTGDITFGYCTEFIVAKASDKSVSDLRVFLDALGDSIVVVDDDEIIKTHVHTDDPGRVLTEALTYGALLKVKIENMREQHTQLTTAAPQSKPLQSSPAPLSAEPAEPEKDFGVVVVCSGEGMCALFEELGADQIVVGGQTMNPSTEDILRAVEAVPAKTVLVFPNNKNIIMAAEQCDPLTAKKVVVIPTKTVPQGVSALLAMDTYSQSEAEMVDVAKDAANAVHTALITYAARDSDFDGHEIRAGQYLTLLDGALHGSGEDILELIEKLGESFAELDPEFITVYYGEDATPSEAALIRDKLAEANPDAELSLVSGGQPVYYYMLSAE